MKRKLLLAAFAAMVTMGVNAQLTNGTVYWLQDTGTGQFLSQGDAWSTKAVMKDVGGLGFEAVLSNGNYLLKNIMWNTVKSTNLGLGADQYVDQTPVEYTITAVTGGYKVSYNGNYLVNNGNENAYKEKPIGKTTDVNAATVWRFLTKTEYDAALQAYYDGRAAAMATSMGLNGITTLSALETEIADESYVKVDQTSKITNPDINGSDNGWTHAKLYRGNDSGGWATGDGCAEFWNGCGYAKQTVSNLPNGLYKVTFVGTYRPDNSGPSNNLVSEKTSSPAFVYANNDKKEFLHWIDVPAKANGRSGITEANGYKHTFYTYVTNGTLELGVIADGWTNGNSWCPFGQFTLTQIYSLAMYQAMLAEAVANASTYNGIIPTAAYDAIQAVVTEKNITWSTAEQYTAAIDAINMAVSTYATSDIQNAYTQVLEAKALYNQTDYTDANNAKATFKGYIDAADATTTLSDLNTAINNIKSHLLDFVTAVTLDANAYFDLTNFLVVNPTVRQNTTGWTIDEIARNNSYSWAVVNYEECEFYQQQFKFYQSLTLPRGTWEFGVTGFHRAGNHSTYFFAGEDKILIPGVGSDVVNNMAGAKTYFDNGNGKVALKFALEETSNAIEIGIENRDTETDRWTIFRDFTLKFYGSAIDYSIYENNWNAAVTAANNAKTAHSDVTVGSEYVALNTALTNTPTGTSKADYVTKTNALIDATAAFNLAAPNYPAMAREIAKAKALGIDNATADSYAATSETTGATALANTQALMVAEYNYVATNYSHAVELGTWNASANAGTLTGQHWDGTSTSSYMEQGGGALAYDLPSWTVTYDQTLSLPAGNYIFKVAGRTATDHVTINLNVTDVTDGENPVLLGTVNDFPKGDVGLGINKAGATSFDAEDAAGFANNGNGRGWQWRYVKFTLANPASVKVEVLAEADAQYSWMGFCNATVQTDDEDNVALMQALVALNEAKAAATLTQRANVGTGVFQYEATTDGSLWSAYTTAKSNAESFVLAADTEVEDVETLTTALTTAQTNYSNNNVLVAPDSEKRYYLNIVDGGQAWNGNAVTFIAGGRGDMGGYAIQYLAPANAGMNQALKFTAVAGEENTYKVSAINVEDGGERYITTGSTYSGNNTQIRTTDEANSALEIKISASATDGQFQLINTADNNKVIGRNSANPDNGMYTDGNVSFTIAEASQASVSVNLVAGKYGTRIFPFTPTLPSAVKAYSCKAVDGSTLTLVEVDSPEANTPYIIYSEYGYSGEALTGWGTATADSYTEGLLTGVYTNAVVPVNSYVLQTPGGYQAFYKVTEEGKKSAANRCYLTLPAESPESTVKAFYLNFSDETAINAVEATQNENAAIFNLAGQRVSKAQKGLYIVNGKKVIMR
ncbi:MAG: hypothetical protein IKR98_00030 [Bacteroidaceae bacterium]|nr:hypothetical protein [Bacteroidaceae bacterium]